jgi:hypothetical protein
MAVWPALDELKQLLDITSEDWDGDDDYGETTRLTRCLSAAIDRIKTEIAGTVAAFDELYDEPTDRMSQAALRMAELLATRPDLGDRAGQDPTLRRLLYGYRRRFGVA